MWSKAVTNDHKVDAEVLPIRKEYMLLRLWMQRGQRSTSSSRGILFKSSNSPILIATKNTDKWMQVLPQHSIPFPAAYMYITVGMITINPDLVTLNSKVRTFENYRNV